MQNAPIPAGRSIVSCKKLLHRLKEKHKDDIEKIKAGQPIAASAATTVDGETTSTPSKPKTPRKRKTKAEGEAEADGDANGSPKKKAASGRKRKAEVVKDGVEDEIKGEEPEDEVTV